MEPETELAVVYEILRELRCSRGHYIDIDLDTETMATDVGHCCCEYTERLEREIQALRARDHTNEAEIRKLEEKIQSLQQMSDKPTSSRQDSGESKDYASLYLAEKLQREAYEEDISQLKKENKNNEIYYDQWQIELRKVARLQQSEKQLRAENKKAAATSATLASTEAKLQQKTEELETLRKLAATEANLKEKNEELEALKESARLRDDRSVW